MNKRPLCQMVVYFILGIGFASILKYESIMIAAMLWVAFSVEMIYKRQIRRWFLRGIFLFAFLLLGCRTYNVQSDKRELYQTEIMDGRAILCQGKIYKKEIKSEKVVYYLKNSIFLDAEQSKEERKNHIFCNSVLVYLDSDEYPIGKTLVLKGTITEFNQARNEGNFDERSFYAMQKIDFKILDGVVEDTYGKSNIYKEKLYQLRNRLKLVFEKCMSEEDAGVLTVMVLGDKSLLDAEVKTLYQRAGISHVLAISGLHISVIGMALYNLLRKRKCSYLKAGLIAGMVIVSFGVMSGLGTSTLRAVLMFLLTIIGKYIGRTYDSLTALGVAAFVILIQNPFLLKYAGFLFSFGAVVGVIAVGQVALKNIGTYENEKGKSSKIKEFVSKQKKIQRETIVISASIQLVTIPMVLSFYYEIPTYSILINLCVIPFMGIVLFAGIIGGVMGLFYLPFGKAVLLVPHVILAIYNRVCVSFLSLPKSSLILGQPSKEKILLYYGILIVMVFLMTQFKKRIFLIIELLTALFITFWPVKKYFEVDVLDVGQGDGTYLSFENGTTFFVDGGSTDVKKVGTYRILPFLKSKGTDHVTYWFVTHLDEDHVSGLKEILEDTNYRIEHLVFAKSVLKDEAYEELCALAEEKKVQILYMNAGDELGMEEFKVECLFPDMVYPVQDRNARSLVFRLERAEFTGIFTGDISSEEENYILGNMDIREVDFYKAAHHGSGYSNSKDFLDKCNPDITSISCGLKNRYGHPGDEAIEHIKEVESEIHYTMYTGEIRLCVNEENKILVQDYLKR